jgi:hypothetical protein
MPISGNSERFFKVTLRGLYGNQPTVNVFHYRQTLPLQSIASDVAGFFIAGPLAAIRSVQNSNQTYQEVEVIDTRDVANFHSEAISLAGATTALEALPGFIVWSLRLLRSTRDMRSGWKRFSGLNEADISGNTFTTGHLALLNAAAPDIADDLIDGIATLAHCIVRDGPTKATPLVDPNDSTTWYYTDVAAQSVPNRVTTQNSRKFFS